MADRVRCEATTKKGEQCLNPTGGSQYCDRHRRRPVITAALQMHLNGGPHYSLRVENILIDGEQVPRMSMGTTTDGSPDFKLTGKELIYRRPGSWKEGEEERLDLLACHLSQEEINDWILERAHA